MHHLTDTPHETKDEKSMCGRQSQGLPYSFPFANHFLWACNYLFPPFSQNWKWNEKEQKTGKKGKQVCGLISLAKGNIVTLSLRHSLTEACSYEYVFLCLFEDVCTYIWKLYMHEYICACVHLYVCVCTFAHFPVPGLCELWECELWERLLLRSKWKASCLPTHTFICRLACGCLPAPMQERVEIHTFQQPLLNPTTCSR